MPVNLARLLHITIASLFFPYVARRLFARWPTQQSPQLFLMW
ncbi:MAG: hypothetical protein ACK5GN_10565 [Pseudomonadota bacterium]